MFTGIVEEMGTVMNFSGGELTLQVSKILDDLKIGDSVAVNGVCLTATKIDGEIVSFDVSPTTEELSYFNARYLRKGLKVNLERALRLDSRLGGHIVQGHIDGKAEIIRIGREGNARLFEFLFPKKLRDMLVRKGSVTIDGISLTISELMSSSFTVAVIPQTYTETNLKEKRVGDFVHIEVDIFARYIKHILKTGDHNERDGRFAQTFFGR